MPLAANRRARAGTRRHAAHDVAEFGADDLLARRAGERVLERRAAACRRAAPASVRTRVLRLVGEDGDEPAAAPAGWRPVSRTRSSKSVGAGTAAPPPARPGAASAHRASQASARPRRWARRSSWRSSLGAERRPRCAHCLADTARIHADYKAAGGDTRRQRIRAATTSPRYRRRPPFAHGPGSRGLLKECRWNRSPT